jgi:hypothetical protein
MNKSEAIKLLYGEKPTFNYDTALPQEWLNRIVDTIFQEIVHYHKNDDPGDVKDEIYTEIARGTVYAYDPIRATPEGFLPFTRKALLHLQHYGTIRDINVIFTPTLPE